MSKDNESIKSINMTDADGKDVSYRIEEIENGYIICESKSWQEGDDFKAESRKYYSKDNPFAKEAENMYDIMKSAMGED